MNLDDVLKEASIIDHSWMENGLGAVMNQEVEDVADPRPNNIKDELEVEWGSGGPYIDLGEDLDVVKRNIPEDDLGDSSGVVLFAREMMNRGVMGEELVAALKGKFDAVTMAAEKDALREQLMLQGFVGCVAVDGRGYASCKDALKAAQYSPFKGSIKCVIGCSCGDAIEMPAAPGEMIIAESSGNSMDDFMASDDSYEPKNVSMCPGTMLPIVSADTDIDESWMAPSSVDMMNVTGLPSGDVDKIEASDADWKEKTKMVFRAAYRNRKASEKESYSKKVDASDHVLRKADNEIELASDPMGQIELEGGVAEIVLESSDFANQDIDMGQELTGLFEGSDEVSLEEAKKAEAPLEMDIRADMTI